MSEDAGKVGATNISQKEGVPAKDSVVPALLIP